MAGFIGVLCLLVIALLSGFFIARYYPGLLDVAENGEQNSKKSPVKPGKASPGRRFNGPDCRDPDDVNPGQPKPYCGALPSLAALNIREAKLQKLPVKLDYPWAFEFLSDSELLVTEFSGQLKRIDVATGQVTIVSGLPEIASGQGQRGLLDVVLHPRFGDNGVIYFSYVIDNGSKKYATAVARAELHGDRLQNVQQIFVALPYGKSSSNFGGALLFDREGFLLIATGDRSDRADSQHPGLLTGKIIRLNDDGTVPDDNPFVDSAVATAPAIYALGVRNPQGLVLDELSGKIYESEHGPMGGDEVNLIEAGKNYGWPIITYGMNYTYKSIGDGTEKSGFEQPLFYYLPSIAVSPLAIYHGEMFREWDGDILVGALKGQAISKLDIVDGRVQSEYQILGELDQRVRDIKIATDGAIWVLLQGGQIYRLFREEAPARQTVEVGQRQGEQIYLTICSSCHSQKVPGVPQISVASDWPERFKKGKEELIRNSIEGYNGMPEKGLCEDCTDQEIKRAVGFMIGQVKQGMK